jgi:hypothetical protein
MRKLVYYSQHWEAHDEFVITVAPEGEESWMSIPLYGVMSEREADWMALFLNRNSDTIHKIYTNMQKDDENG